MKRLSIVSAAFVLIFQSLVLSPTLAQVQDNDIRILAVAANGVSTVDVIEQMNFLELHWPGSNGVTVTLANGGVPVPLSTTLSGNALNQLNQAQASPLWGSLRQTWSADLMLVFSPSIPGTECGRAVQINWTSVDDPIPGLFVPNPLTFGLDLRGAIDSYSAVAQVGGGCPVLTAAHEMVHLLGSGHTKSVAAGFYLTNTSHATAMVINLGPIGGIIGLKTIGAQGENPPECTNSPFGAIQCQYATLYSDGVTFGTDNTLATFNTTALSVANYLQAAGSSGGGGGGAPLPECNDGIDNDGDSFIDFGDDPDCESFSDDSEEDTGGGGGGSGCSLQTPSNLTASPPMICSPWPYTQYTLSWIDTCPSATVDYEIHKAQPTTSGFVFGWKTFVPSTPAFINGVSALAKVRACDLFNCSGFSNTILAVDGC